MYYIYKVTNKINWKTYIGQTVQAKPETRWRQHKYAANRILEKDENYVNRHDYFHNAIAKHGSENFKFEIIDTAETRDELNKKERKWIYYYNSDKRKYGYNTEKGGRKEISDDKKEEYSKLRSKIAKEMFEKNPNLKENLKKMQLERIKNGTNKVVKYGKEHPFSKNIFQLDLNGKIIKEFGGSFEADRETGVNQSDIIRCCKNKQITAGDYFWIYKEDYSKEKINELIEKKKSRHMLKHNREVVFYDIKTNNIINKFSSIKKAAEFLNVYDSTLNKKFKKNNGIIYFDSFYIKVS